MSYIQGETITITATHRDKASGNLVDPTSIKITITDYKNGEELGWTDMVKDADGTYHYDYAIADTAKGPYTILCKTVYQNRTTKEKTEYTVEIGDGS